MLKEAVKELFPPEVPPLMRWRLAVFAYGVVGILTALWAVSPYGFAYASDLNAIKNDVNDIKTTLLEQSIFAAKESECTAVDDSARRFFQQRVLSLGRDYYRLTGIPVTVPPCRS